MTISSRTPEGEPHRCPICDEVANLEPSYPGGDACCPSCGALVWRCRNLIAQTIRMEPERLDLTTAFDDIITDSMDMVEFVMRLEEEFDIAIPDDAAERIATVEEAIRYIVQSRRRGS